MRPTAALATYDEVPLAASLPAGAVVLAVDGTERRSLKLGAAVVLAGVFFLGVAIGRWTAKGERRGRRNQ